MTIQRIGKKPNAAPSVPASSACPTGISKSTIATTSATPSEIRPASHALSAQATEQHEQGEQRDGAAQAR